ncbi:hypothetical protein LOY54_14205 [Pseudomonas sp. B21-032]|uniref:hypothetical protein n=1 Tax=Pseudomonas sp. B21-032 TaxID=2895483 RepID=UPI0021603430|nr:hypothetical protein [Pseudomonas sp. B21-032]UVL59213.1 hypothetical protein LOY54_14205 [Pseudomonas sp. B21-032]
MNDRYSVVHRPRVDLIAIKTGTQTPAVPMEQYCYRIEDSLADGDYVGGPYQSKPEADAACAQLNRGVDILFLPYANRALLVATNALHVEAGREVLAGLTRQESERYAELLLDSEPTDEFIDLEHKHREARTGYKVDPA